MKRTRNKITPEQEFLNSLTNSFAFENGELKTTKGSDVETLLSNHTMKGILYEEK
jgi:hypothetical protein